MYARAASILANIGLSYARRYAPKALAAGAATVATTKAIREMAYTKRSGRKKSKPTTRAYKAPPTVRAKRVPKMGIRRKQGGIMPYSRAQPVQNARFGSKTYTESADNSRAYHSSTQGRQLSSTTLAKKATLSSLQRQIFFVRAYEQETSAGAPFWNRLSHTVTGTRRDYPLYLYDITARPQYVGGANLLPFACIRPYCDVTGANDGKIKWQTVNHRDSVNNNTAYWNYEESSSLASAQSFSTSMLKWVEIRMQIQGPRNIPGRIRVDLVQLLDDEYDNAPNGSSVVDGTNSTPHQVFWQSVIAEDVCNPIHKITRPKRPGFRFLGSKSFVTQPRESIDNDTRGQMHVLKWFVRLNHTCNYNNAGTTFTDDANQVTGVLPTNTAGNTVSPYTDTSKKIFLMVRSLAPSATAAVDNTVHGSFEINMRTCHSVLV